MPDGLRIPPLFGIAAPIMATTGDTRIRMRLVDTLYVDAMVLADEARGYFDDGGRAERGALAPMARVGFSCESLKVTTRLMHVIAWLLTQRAVAAGEMPAADALHPSRRLGAAPITDPATVVGLPAAACALIDGSIDLHRRVAALDAAIAGEGVHVSPARRMQERLAARF